MYTYMYTGKHASHPINLQNWTKVLRRIDFSQGASRLPLSHVKPYHPIPIRPIRAQSFTCTGAFVGNSGVTAAGHAAQATGDEIQEATEGLKGNRLMEIPFISWKRRMSPWWYWNGVRQDGDVFFGLGIFGMGSHIIKSHVHVLFFGYGVFGIGL